MSMNAVYPVACTPSGLVVEKMRRKLSNCSRNACGFVDRIVLVYCMRMHIGHQGTIVTADKSRELRVIYTEGSLTLRSLLCALINY